jgi:hypothetical protein
MAPEFPNDGEKLLDPDLAIPPLNPGCGAGAKGNGLGDGVFLIRISPMFYCILSG